MSRGTQLRRLREQAGLTQAELASRIGITTSVLSAYENGRREPRVDIFFAAVEAAGFHIEFERSGLDLRVPDAVEKNQISMQVTGMVAHLPNRDRGALRYPPFRALVPA